MSAPLTVTVLGCGGSDGVPLIGGDGGQGAWGRCDPAEPRNRRSRASIHVSDGQTGLLIDLSPDLRQQLLSYRIATIDAVLVTHEHADHTHGIHELRRLSKIAGHEIPLFTDDLTATALETRFGYVFAGSNGYSANAIMNRIRPGQQFLAGTLNVLPFEQDHGFGNRTLGFRIGPLAYSTDVVALPPAAFEALAGIDTWIVDCVQETPHPTHANLATALAWIERVKPRQAILTHMGPQLDYRTLRAQLPERVEPAYDGLVCTLKT